MSKKEIKPITTSPDKKFIPLHYSQSEIQIEPKLLSRILEAAQKQLEVIKSREERAKVWEAARELAQTAIKKGQTAEEVIKEANTDPHSAKLIEKIYSALTNTKEKTTRLKRLTFQRIMFTLISLSMFLAACVPQSEEKPPTETEPIVTLPADLPETDEPVTGTAEVPSTEIVVGPTATEIAMKATSLNDVAIYRDPVYQLGAFTIWKVRDGVDSPYSEDMVFMESPFPGKEDEILFINMSNFAEKVPGVTHLGIGIKDGEIVITGLNNSDQIIGYVGYDAETDTAGYARATDADGIQANEEKGYFELSMEERLAKSEAYGEQINYTGSVKVIPDVEGGANYPSYWSPTWNSWRSAHNTPDEDLDKTGISFPETTETGYEDEEGYLWHEGVRLPKFSFNGKEMSMREMYEMKQTNLADFVVDDIALKAPGFDNPDDESVRIITTMKEQAMFLPGYRTGEQNNFYSYLSAKGGDNELPEVKKSFYELPTNEFLIPIYSKATGEFMIFLNVQQANHFSSRLFIYSDAGDVTYKKTAFSSSDNFGANGQDQFSILIDNRFARVAHNLGGGDPLLQGSEGIGDANDIERILNAETDEEKISLINQFRMFVAYPIIVVPER